MLRADVAVCLEIKGPLLTQSTAPGEFGLDAVVARNIDGTPYIAGSHLAGKIRQALEEIESCGSACTWFRPEVKDKITGRPGINYQPLSKAVLISDFLLQQCENHKQINRTRIQIDSERGAVKKGAQLFIDSPFASGEPVTFKGDIIFFISDEDALGIHLKHIEAALKWTTQLGGYRSIGFGRLQNVSINKPQKNTYQATGNWPGTSRTVDILLQPLHPFCIAGKQVDKNLFEAEEVIPGGAVLGSIATSWGCLAGEDNFCKISRMKDDDRKELKEIFNSIKVSHGFPSADGLIRPVVPPLSLVKVNTENCKPYYDVARCDKPCLIHNQTPEFRVDWKDSSDVMQDFGWPSTRKEMRVRTAIDPKYLRSKESSLFAYEMIVPDNLSWITRITVPEQDADKTRSQLASLLEHGITGLGKTKTAASIQLLPEDTVQSRHASTLELRDGLWIITLQTPALLCDPSLLINSGDRQTLHTAYEDTFIDISCNSLRLFRYFAQQKLAGGKYLYSRFQRGENMWENEKPYSPWLLTTEGSVFVLAPVSSKDEEAQKYITEWFNNGLSMPKWARDKYSITKAGKQVDGSHWAACPYIRQNGYGEIAVNLDVHWNAFPEADIRRDIEWIGEGEGK